MPLSPGQVLNQRYRIVRLLGQGGFGAVYRAWDVQMAAACAVKENLDTSPEAQEQFVREARLLNMLKHPNLPRATDYFTIPGQGQYLVMDFIEGQNLKEIVSQGGALPPDQALDWIGQVCDAVIFMHTRQPPVIHRDIKPENIKITPGGQAVLVDFGIAKLYDPTTNTSTGARAYTPGYASPEQHSGRLTDAQSDIYSLGATAYTMLTGQTPPDTNEIFAGLQNAPLPAHQVNSLVPVHVGQAVEKAMQLKRAARPGSVTEFKAALFATPHFGAAQPVAAALSAAIYTATNVQALAQPQNITPAPSRAKARTSWLVWIIGLIFVGVIAVAFITGWGMSGGANNQRTATALGELAERLTPATPTRTSRPVLTATFSPTATFPPATKHPSATFTVIPDTPTSIQPLEPTLAIGTKMISEKDGMTMVYVPAGPFLMGSEWGDDEKPQHEVTLDAFWIDQTEVTNAMYAKCVADGACQSPSEALSSPRNAYYGDPKYADHPVINVPWNYAESYCRWAGRGLPTEAQWEKAARGDDGRIYPWGDNDPTGNLANYCDKNCSANWKDANVDDEYAVTAPVGSYPAGASPYGALDMAGNVWEWVNDWYRSSYYSGSPSINPTGPGSGDYRAMRGGGWYADWTDLRVVNRYGGPVLGYASFGFRCAALPVR